MSLDFFQFGCLLLMPSKKSVKYSRRTRESQDEERGVVERKSQRQNKYG